MPDDPRALKIFIDGNAYKNPGGPGGCAGIVVYPDEWNLPNREIFTVGFHHTTNNRTELSACIRAYEYVRDNGGSLGVQRVLIATDSQYLHKFLRIASQWRRNGWKTKDGRPVENRDLWKELLSLQGRVRIRTEVVWKKGKKLPILLAVDAAAKEAGKKPTETDRGFRQGKVGRSKVKGGASRLFPAQGQEVAIYVYRTGLVGKAHHKVFFNLYTEEQNEFSGKYRAYTTSQIAIDLHRWHISRVRFNANPANPTIERLICEVFQPCTDGE